MNTTHNTHRPTAARRRWQTATQDHAGVIVAGPRPSNWTRMVNKAKDEAAAGIASYPALALAVALSVGAITGWFVKRK